MADGTMQKNLLLQDYTVSGTTDSRGLLQLSALGSAIPVMEIGTGYYIAFLNGSNYGYSPYAKVMDYNGNIIANTAVSLKIRCLT